MKINLWLTPDRKHWVPYRYRGGDLQPWGGIDGGRVLNWVMTDCGVVLRGYRGALLFCRHGFSRWLGKPPKGAKKVSLTVCKRQFPGSARVWVSKPRYRRSAGRAHFLSDLHVAPRSQALARITSWWLEDNNLTGELFIAARYE